MANLGYVIREKADADLERIFEYSVDNFGAFRAEKYIYELEQAFRILAENPKLGRPLNFGSKCYLHFPIGSHSIFYSSNKPEIEILRILHKSMLPLRHL